jgi:hypothetical protein
VIISVSINLVLVLGIVKLFDCLVNEIFSSQDMFSTKMNGISSGDDPSNIKIVNACIEDQMCCARQN